MKKFKAGFTLIELLVVIAIIGILSAVVLASLSTARQKAADAKIEEQMTSFRNAAGEYFTTNGNFGADNTATICNVDSTDTTGLYTLELGSSYVDGTPPACSTNADVGTPATQWDASHELSNLSFFCVDSTGGAKVEPSGWVAPTDGSICP